MNESHIRNVVEAALLAGGKPLHPAELVELFDEASRPQLQEVQAALHSLMAEYEGRGIEVKETANGFRIQVRREMANEISRLWPERPARYSRALLETLALIAYRQPITRAEIEAVRGVAVNPNILKTVIERNWVRVVGHRDVPGRPELLGTTRDFLDYFGLRSLDELPPLAELKAIGEIKVQFDLADPGPVPVAQEGTDTGNAAAPLLANESASSDAPSEATATASGADPVATSESADTGEGARSPQAAAGSLRDTPGSPRDTAGSPRDAAHEAEEFVARVDADLAAGDDEAADDDELSAAGPASNGLVAGPRDLDD
jgi:segregation and condensation protein B